MDSASVESLTPILDGIDRWVELAPLLPVLVILELVLSADNAIALASITKRLNSLKQQRLALNIGIAISLLLRIIVILGAQIILRFWFIKIIAGIYLIYLFINKAFVSSDQLLNSKDNNVDDLFKLIQTIFLLAFTDLAFSIDSIAAAVAISDQLLLVITGAFIGVIALRFTSGLFIKWLEEYVRLEIAGYIAVGIIGIRLLLSTIYPSFVSSELALFVIMALIFFWGFSKRSEVDDVK